LERSVLDFDILLQLAKSGCYLAYDMFGEESSWYPFDPSIRLPNDGMKIDIIKKLINKGYLDQILISHDICRKANLVKYGGDGWAHIPKNVVPLMRYRGLTEDQIQTIIVDNPKRWLQFR
jgi:phosphotriesterase-related protein